MYLIYSIHDDLIFTNFQYTVPPSLEKLVYQKFANILHRLDLFLPLHEGSILIRRGDRTDYHVTSKVRPGVSEGRTTTHESSRKRHYDYSNSKLRRVNVPGTVTQVYLLHIKTF